MHRVYLYAVHARLAAENGRFGVGVDDIVYLLHGQRAVLHGGIPHVGQIVARRDHGVFEHFGRHFVHAAEQQLRAAEARAELQEEFRAVGVDLVHELTQRPAEQLFGLIQPAFPEAASRHRRHAGYHQADVRLCAGDIVLSRPLLKLSAEAYGARAAHGAEHYAVFQRDAPYLQGSKQRFVVFHLQSSCFFVFTISYLPRICK